MTPHRPLLKFAFYYKVLSMNFSDFGAAATAKIVKAAAPPTTGASGDPSNTLARAILLHALLLGVAADALLRDGPAGIGFTIWISLVALGARALCRRAERPMSREAAAWLATAVLFSFGLAWRDSSALGFIDFLVTVAALGMAAVAISDEDAALFAGRLRDTVWAGFAIIASVASGILPLAWRELFASRTRQRPGLRFVAIARAAMIAGLLVFVFGSLLRSADPIFASLVTMPDLDFGRLVSHLLMIGLFTWIVGGWARGALLDGATKHRPPDALPFQLGMLDVTTALVTLNLLFGVFVLSQLGWFFGGEEFLRARTGLTAAQYARQGFFQMVWVIVLVVPLLMATRAALGPGAELRRRHGMLSLPLIALLGAILFSVVARMRLYVQYYGLTTDRFYPLALMGWLAFVLVWLALTVLRDRSRRFVAGAVISGLITLAILNAIAPDAIVARVNVARASRAVAGAQPALDFGHLAVLSGEAVPIAVAAILAPSRAAHDVAAGTSTELDRCQAARVLLRRWGPSAAAASRARGETAWRTWNAGNRNAIAAVGARAAELRAVGGRCRLARPSAARD